jgi:hypothetical protein
VSVWGGYTTLAMGKVNDSLDAYSLGLTGKSVSKMESGVIMGVDLDAYKINDNVTVGPRISYISANTGKSSGENTATSTTYTGLGSNITINGVHYNYLTKKNTTDVATYKKENNATLMPVLFGGKYVKKIGEKLNLAGILYAGIGFANFETKINEKITRTEEVSGPLTTTTTTSSVISTTSNTSASSKSGFMADLGFVADYIITEKVSIGTGIGYRMADIDDVDFSGLTATLGLSYKL